MVNIEIRCMASHFITQKRVYNTPDNDSLVLEKCDYVLDKSLKSPGISFRKKCGNLVRVHEKIVNGILNRFFPVVSCSTLVFVTVGTVLSCWKYAAPKPKQSRSGQMKTTGFYLYREMFKIWENVTWNAVRRLNGWRKKKKYLEHTLPYGLCDS